MPILPLRSNQVVKVTTMHHSWMDELNTFYVHFEKENIYGCFGYLSFCVVMVRFIGI